MKARSYLKLDFRLGLDLRFDLVIAKCVAAPVRTPTAPSRTATRPRISVNTTVSKLVIRSRISVISLCMASNALLTSARCKANSPVDSLIKSRMLGSSPGPSISRLTEFEPLSARREIIPVITLAVNAPTHPIYCVMSSVTIPFFSLSLRLRIWLNRRGSLRNSYLLLYLRSHSLSCRSIACSHPSKRDLRDSYALMRLLRDDLRRWMLIDI